MREKWTKCKNQEGIRGSNIQTLIYRMPSETISDSSPHQRVGASGNWHQRRRNAWIQIMRADKMQILKRKMKDNSNIKIRSHQRLVMPPKSGSFRQLTSTRSKQGRNFVYNRDRVCVWGSEWERTRERENERERERERKERDGERITTCVYVWPHLGIKKKILYSVFTLQHMIYTSRGPVSSSKT